MKKTIVLMVAAVAVLALGCFEDESEDKDVTKLNVTVQYTGTLKADVAGTSDGDGKIHVQIFTTAPTNGQYMDTAGITYFKSSTAAAVAQNTDYVVSFIGIPAGTYYVMAFYDYKMHSTTLGRPGNTDRYRLYNNVTCSNNGANLTTVTVTAGGTAEISGANKIVINETQLGSNGVFRVDTTTTSCTPN